MSSETIGLTFVGYGSIAEDHADVFRKLGGVHFDAVVGRRPEPTAEFAERFGFAFHTTDLDEALARPTTDAVVICSPSDVHAAQTAAALNAGKDVLCEIPLAMNAPDAERVAGLAETKGRVLMVAHTQRYFPAIQEVRRRIVAGEFHPYHLICRWGFFRRENVNWKGRRRSWTDNLIWHHGCHVVDMALWTLDETEAVEVKGIAAPPDERLRIPLDLNMSFETAGGCLVTIAMSYNTPWPFHDYLWIGEEDSLLYEGGVLKSKEGTVFEGGRPSMVAQNEEFLAAVRERRTPAIDGRAVLPAMRVLQAIQDQNPGA